MATLSLANYEMPLELFLIIFHFLRMHFLYHFNEKIFSNLTLSKTIQKTAWLLSYCYNWIIQDFRQTDWVHGRESRQVYLDDKCPCMTYIFKIITFGWILAGYMDICVAIKLMNPGV